MAQIKKINNKSICSSFGDNAEVQQFLNNEKYLHINAEFEEDTVFYTEAELLSNECLVTSLYSWECELNETDLDWNSFKVSHEMLVRAGYIKISDLADDDEVIVSKHHEFYTEIAIISSKIQF